MGFTVIKHKKYIAIRDKNNLKNVVYNPFTF